MANENKNYFEFIDIPDGSGGTDRRHVKDAEAHVYASRQEIAALFHGDSLPGDATQFKVATTSEIIAMMEETDGGGEEEET